MAEYLNEALGMKTQLYITILHISGDLAYHVNMLEAFS